MIADMPLPFIEPMIDTITLMLMPYTLLLHIDISLILMLAITLLPYATLMPLMPAAVITP